MKVVLDTNVVVSALLNVYGPSAQTVFLWVAREFTVCCDSRIFQEYKDVLFRPKFQFPPQSVEDFLSFIESEALWVISKPLTIRLIDQSDEIFLEAAVAGRADYLITGNLKHFPHAKYNNTQIVSPAKFIQLYQAR